MSLVAIILCAGSGTRMKSNLPKVLVLEVKFPKELRDYVVHAFGDIPLRGSRFSKYVSGFLSINN